MFYLLDLFICQVLVTVVLLKMISLELVRARAELDLVIKVFVLLNGDLKIVVSGC